MNYMRYWSKMTYVERVKIAHRCGWAPRTASRIAETEWGELTPAAKKVLGQHDVEE